MLAEVTNRSGAARGFATRDRGTVLVEPGAVALLDLADHPLHDTWAQAGHALVQPLSDKDAKATRRRLDAEAELQARAMRDALAALPRRGSAES